MSSMSGEVWPALRYESWQDTYATLHMWMQVVGKVALAQSPPLNHSWGIAFQITPRGMSTRTLPHGSRTFTIEFDFIEHFLRLRASDGAMRALALEPMTVADFYAAVMALLDGMALPAKIWPMPVEVPAPIRFTDDTVHRSYDANAANRAWRIFVQAERVLSSARCDFVGKASPAHFFWGAFDLALTRFSGKPAPPRDGPAFMQEAYSHEVISHGFWPGSAPILEPAFYAYAAPVPAGLDAVAIEPDAAYYHRELGEFILPYEAVRRSPNPDGEIRRFIATTYDRAATLAGWDRALLERVPGATRL